jgi:nucleotide-binding universal stress UspA family protein
MNNNPDLRILFLTSFSDACFRTGRTMAQLADSCRLDITMAHVTARGCATKSARAELDSFLAEFDHYESCKRLLIEADDPTAAAAELCENNSFDLLVAPASDRLGLHSFFTSSFRARLLKRCSVPLWTVGPSLDEASFSGPMRTIGCMVDLEKEGDAHVPLAAAFAARIGARLRILHVVPNVDEGTLAQSVYSNAPLMPSVAVERFEAAFAGMLRPEIDVSIGRRSRELPAMLRRCHADLMFVGPGQALNGLFQPRLSRFLDRLPCPVVCIDGASTTFSRWSFQQNRSSYQDRQVSPRHDYVRAG